MVQRCIRNITLLVLFTSFYYSMGCFEPMAGENQWRMIARIGECVNTVDINLLSVSDTLLSAIDAISVSACDDTALLSVSDVLSSKIMDLDTELLSISDVLLSAIDAISVSACDDTVLLSVSDVLSSKIMDLDADLLSVSDTLLSAIDSLESACQDVPLFSAPTIVLATPSTTYCLVEDFNGNITIAAENIVLDLNGHAVVGTIDILDPAVNTLIHNGKIAPSVIPVDSTIADYGIVHIALNAHDVHIIDCIIEDNSAFAGEDTNAYTAINTQGSYTLIEHCVIHTATGGNGNIGGNGGDCIAIQSTALNTHIITCTLTAGNGGTSSSTAATSTGDGGNGVVDFGQSTLIQWCDIRGGASGSLNVTGDLADGSIITMGSGGNAVEARGLGLSILNSILQGGNGDVTTASGNIAINAGLFTASTGGDAVDNVVDRRLVISDCELYGGSTGFVVASLTIGTNNGQLLASRAGYGLLNEPGGSLVDGPVIKNSIVYGGTSGNVVAINGDIGSIGAQSAASNGGDGIHTSTYGLQVTDCVIVGGAGANISTVVGNIINIVAGRGGHGIFEDNGLETFVTRCSIESGIGGNLATNDEASEIFTPSQPGDAGTGIFFATSQFALVTNCTIHTGNGGSSASAGPVNSVTSGAGGTGVHMSNDVNGTRIRSTSIGPTGSSGNVFGLIGGTSGAGGDGIFIDTNAGGSDPVEVSKCKISYTGDVGLANTPGTQPGQAIRDLSGNAMIYTNYAHDIADTVTPYTLAINVPIVAVDAPTGTPFALGTDRLSNIYR